MSLSNFIAREAQEEEGAGDSLHDIPVRWWPARALPSETETGWVGRREHSCTHSYGQINRAWGLPPPGEGTQRPCAASRRARFSAAQRRPGAPIPHQLPGGRRGRRKAAAGPGGLSSACSVRAGSAAGSACGVAAPGRAPAARPPPGRWEGRGSSQAQPSGSPGASPSPSALPLPLTCAPCGPGPAPARPAGSLATPAPPTGAAPDAAARPFSANLRAEEPELGGAHPGSVLPSAPPAPTPTFYGQHGPQLSA